MENEIIEYQFYAIIDNDNNAIGFTLKENDYPWFKDSDKQPQKAIVDDNGIYLFKNVDGAIVERDDADKIAEVKRQTIDRIKSECQNAIYSKYPNWLQNNLQSRALELLERITEGAEITGEELSDKTSIKAIEADIKAMRDKSNEYEASLSDMSIDDMQGLVCEFIYD